MRNAWVFVLLFVLLPTLPQASAACPFVNVGDGPRLTLCDGADASVQCSGPSCTSDSTRYTYAALHEPTLVGTTMVGWMATTHCDYWQGDEQHGRCVHGGTPILVAANTPLTLAYLKMEADNAQGTASCHAYAANANASMPCEAYAPFSTYKSQPVLIP